jgi:hypothetical protein
LRGQVESLAAKVDTLTSTQQEHAAALDDITELRHQVDKILAVLTDQDDASPAEWFWLTMSDQAREEKFSELYDWVETVYRTQYPGYLAGHVRPCWPGHPEARWELAWLYQQWTLTYLAKRPAPKTPPTGTTAGPPASSAALMSQCEGTCQAQPGLNAVTAPGHRERL